MRLSGAIVGGVVDFDPYERRTEDDPTHDYGALFSLNDRRSFRYAKAGAAVSKGKISQAPAAVANHSNMVVAAAVAAGAVRVTLTPGATAGTNGEYDDGYLVINDNAGEGQVYRVSHNPAITASTVFSLELAEPVQVALTTASEATLVHNQFNGSVEAAVATRRVVGIPLRDLSSGDFGWYQTLGVVGALAQGAIAIGSDVTCSTSVAGAVAVTDTTSAATANAQTKVGRANIIAGVDTEYRPLTLSID